MRVLKPEIGVEGDVMLLQSGDIFGGTDGVRLFSLGL